MSHKDKLASAVALIQSHNNLVEDPKDRIDADAFIRKLKSMGGTTEAALEESSWEDLENCGLPRLLARKVAAIFRQKAEVSSLMTFSTPQRAAAMASLNLLAQYNPDEPTSIIAKELVTRSKGKKFIVFNADGSIHVPKSNELLNELTRRWPEREYVEVDGSPRRVYRAGDGRAEMVDESPIYSGRALRPDGTDDQLGRSWDGVSFATRQLIHLAVNNTGEIGRTNKDAHDTLDMALTSEGEKKLQARCRKAVVLLAELIEQNNAPKLKIARGGAVNARANDPFYQNNKTY